MTKHTIGLSGSHTVGKGPRDKSWTASVTVDLAKLTTEIVERLALHGLTQKIADAASGATSADEANGAMQKAADAILAGDWSSRREASGVDERTRVARQIVRGIYKAKLGGKSPEWAEFTGMSNAEQAEVLDKLVAKNEAKLAPMIDEKLATLRAERERNANVKADFAL